ncbi:MAG: hypothetical protein Q9163_000849 [Psora crenata]
MAATAQPVAAQKQQVTQRQGATAVSQEVITDELQSFEMVHTLVQSSMWDLFPEECFKKRDLASARHEAQRFYYRATNGVQGGDVVDNKGKLATILRGARRGSDKVLDWLDAAFECTIDHALQSLHISITNHPVSPSTVFETFRLSFEYHQPEYGVKNRLVALSDVTTIGEPITVESVRHGLETILRRLNASENFLRKIPGELFSLSGPGGN